MLTQEKKTKSKNRTNYNLHIQCIRYTIFLIFQDDTKTNDRISEWTETVLTQPDTANSIELNCDTILGNTGVSDTKILLNTGEAHINGDTTVIGDKMRINSDNSVAKDRIVIKDHDSEMKKKDLKSLHEKETMISPEA